MATSRERNASVSKPSDSGIDEDVQTIVDACLNELGRAPPPVSFFREMAKQSAISPTKESVQARMDQQKTRHKKELESLYDIQAKARKQLLLQHRIAMDDGDYHPDLIIGERNRQRQTKLPPQISYPAGIVQQQSLTFNTSVEWLSLAFAQSQLPLATMCAELEERRNTILPTSLAEFNLIKSSAHQLRVARYFEGKIVPWQGIAKNAAEIEAAQLAYHNDPEFQRAVISFLSSKQSVDPRKRGSIP